MVADDLSFVRALVATNLKATLALRSAFVIQVVFMAHNTRFSDLYSYWVG